ncbi:MAG: hypothetical protein ACRC1M_06935 [Methanobacteriaceae archaeon]
MENNVFLYFDKNGNPAFFRVLNATKKFNTSKDALRHLKPFSLHIGINEDVIDVKLNFLLVRRNGSKKVDLAPHVANKLNIPSFDNNFVLAST